MRAKDFVSRSLGEAFYYRARGRLSTLLSEPFLGSCVLKGGFSALALNAPSDQGNSFAVLPGGMLVLSLDRESFQASSYFIFLYVYSCLCGCPRQRKIGHTLWSLPAMMI